MDAHKLLGCARRGCSFLFGSAIHFYSYHSVLPISIYSIALVLAAIYILWKAVTGRIVKYKECVIALFCLFLDLFVYIMDIFLTNRNYNLAPFATIVLIYFEAIAITVQFARVEQERNLAQTREEEIAESNALIARMSRLKSDFLHTVAHEMKTPLTVMSGFAQITDWQLQDGTVDESTGRNLKYISAEAARLSAMVERLSKLALDNDLTPPKEKIEVSAFLRYFDEICEPIVRKNGNRLKIECEKEMALFINKESLLQVLLNLVINANKHTKNGWIEIIVKDTEGFATLTVEDNGNGIDFCRAIKKEKDIPILFLSALGANRDMIEGLQAGGNDYLVKPYPLDVLAARIEVQLRSVRQKEAPFNMGDLDFDIMSGIAYCHGKNMNLTKKEFVLLHRLAVSGKKQKSVSKEKLYETAWGQTYDDDSRALWSAISRLKGKLKEFQSEFVINYSRTEGYLLEKG